MHAYIDAHSQILIDECPGDGVQYISIFQYQCANTTFDNQRIYNRMFQQLVHKGGDSSINYNKIFQNSKALEVSVVNSYTEDQLMCTLLKNLQRGGNYSTKIVSHQAELRGEEKFIDHSWMLM